MENRKTFFARITPFMAPSDIRNVEIAYMMSKFGHRSQVRKELDQNGKPIRYFEHPRRVAIILLDELKISDPKMIISALLHDCLEDTKDIHEGIIEQIFGKEVVETVKLLSKTPKEGYYDRLLKYGNKQTFFIKGCDRLDNLRSLKATNNVEFQERQILETKEKIYPMLSALISTTPFYDSNNFGDRIAANRLQNKIISLVDEFKVSE